MLVEGKVGPAVVIDGTTGASLRQSRDASVVTLDGHARYQEAVYRGNVYTFGLTNTALVAANAIATGVTSTAQPLIGVWNPATSSVNLVLLAAIINTTTVANSAVSPAGFMWVAATSQSAISTGSTPINCKTLAAAGSQAKAYAVSTALTGLVGSLTQVRASTIGTINAAGPATAVPQGMGPSTEQLDGLFIVPPGTFLGLMNQVSTTTVSVNCGLIWEEIPV